MTAHARRPNYSPRPICPDPYCGKLWAPTKRAARELREEISTERNSWPAVRYYEHAGGWHFTRDIHGAGKHHHS